MIRRPCNLPVCVLKKSIESTIGVKSVSPLALKIDPILNGATGGARSGYTVALVKVSPLSKRATATPAASSFATMGANWVPLGAMLTSVQSTSLLMLTDATPEELLQV